MMTKYRLNKTNIVNTLIKEKVLLISKEDREVSNLKKK